jgi:hypothetical protein
LSLNWGTFPSYRFEKDSRVAPGDHRDLPTICGKNSDVKNSPEPIEVDRLVLRTMPVDSLKAQISGGRAAVFANALRTTRSTLSTLPASLPSQASTIAIRNDARFLVELFDFPHPIAVIPAIEKQNVATPDGM